jgi:choice-of-anchor B domain-containing protein
MRHVLRTFLATAGLLTLASSAANAQAGQFGRAVVIDADEVIVGEPSNSFRPGVVYTYRRDGAGWVEHAQLRSPDADLRDGFGGALALSAGSLFVSAGDGVHVFDRAGDGWRHAMTIETPADAPAQFGTTLAAAGEWLFVGAPGPAAVGRGGRPGGAGGERPSGAVYTFRRGSDGAWAPAGRLAAHDAAAGDGFGTAIHADPDRVVIGAPGAQQGAGAAHVFTLTGAEWQHSAHIPHEAGQANDAFGSTITVAGDMIAIGAPGSGGSGSVFTFSRDAQGLWAPDAQVVVRDGTPADRFGSAMVIAGNDLIIGAPMGGRGFATGWAQVFRGGGALQRLTPSKTNAADAFGRTIAMRDDVVAISATGLDHGAGGVYVFERGDSGDWSETAALVSPPDILDSVTGGEVRCGDDGTAGVFECSNVEMLSFLTPQDLSIDNRGTRLNDIWGWTDPGTGREYALVARIDGTAFVDITDPVNPRFLGELPQTPGGPPSSTWRDVKVYRDHAFIVADAAGEHGMQVFDLTQLRNVGAAPVRFEPTAHYTRINSAHNIVINEETGFAYSVGSSSGGETCGGGLHMIDVRDPVNPTFAGCFADPQTGRASTGYSHDAQCVVYAGPDERYTGREICLGSNENALSIADVTDKANPVALSRASYPNPGYTHQGWLDEDHHYFYMNDELDEIAGTASEGTRTIIWDLSRLDDPQLHHEFTGTTRASDHNLYVRGNLMYQSNYRAGLRIIDISDPGDPVEVAYFDTAPYLEPEPGFSGTWSNYPFFDSGTIIVSSVQEGLFVLKKRDPNVVF